MMVVACASIVKAWVHKNVTRNPLVEAESKGILPFQLGALIGSIAIEASFPTYIVRELPVHIDRKLRTEVMQLALTLIDTVTTGQALHD